MISFRGRLNRASYLVGVLICFLVPMLFVLGLGAITGKSEASISSLALILLLFHAIWFVVGSSFYVRRLHDFGASGGWLLVPIAAYFIAALVLDKRTPETLGPILFVFAGLWTIGLALVPGAVTDNRYGARPRPGVNFARKVEDAATE